MEISLDCLRPGQEGVVSGVDTDEQLKVRLQAFGMVPGTNVYCGYRSPGGSITALEFRGTVVALRTRDMKKIRAQCV